MRASVPRILCAPTLFALMALCAFGAAPATNPAAAGKFDDVALRARPVASKSGEKSLVSASGATSEGFDTRRVALSLAAVISLILLLRFAIRKFLPQAGRGISSGATRVLSRTMIAPKQQVILLQVGRRVVVVGDCGTQMSALAEITDPDEIASLVGQIKQDKSSTAVSRAFGGMFKRARKPFDDEIAADVAPEESLAPSAKSNEP